ncbi:unnamed protein product [Mytilus edulis]|uniref:Uncharacterized protein n=1 Tax=Mytilus edulis TaxID=6550 RepID=A0A8S3R323_MYTED|nr:unnamed protein product [Mytilus edulis]
MQQIECNATFDKTTKTSLPSVLLSIEHLFHSVTNSEPYSSSPKIVPGVTFGGNISSYAVSVTVSRSYRQKITFAYNGSHICATAQHRLETDTCWGRSSTGCYNKTTTCDSTCFLSNEYYKRHTINLFDSLTSSSSFGTWTESDWLSMYTTSNKQLECFHRDEGFYRFENNQYLEEPNLPRVTCPIGQRCRITLGKYLPSSFPKAYVGCEKDNGHYDGNEQEHEECSTWQTSPDGNRIRWALMCKYCCNESLCNNPMKCCNLDCDQTSNLSHRNIGKHVFLLWLPFYTYLKNRTEQVVYL